jgi:hypothetical protein
MAFIAEGLTAGLKPPNSELSRKRRTRRGRKQYPRKSNLTFDGWVLYPMMKIVNDLEESLRKYPPIKMGTPDPYQPPTEQAGSAN